MLSMARKTKMRTEMSVIEGVTLVKGYCSS